MMFTHKRIRKIATVSAAGAIAFVSGFAFFVPAKAGSIVQQIVSIACHDPSTCISITNKSATGTSIVGVAQNASAIVGKANVNTNKIAFPFGNLGQAATGGLTGVDASTNALDTNAGVYGTSKSGTGVIGVTTSESRTFFQSGVLGFDNTPTINGSVGVQGFSNHNIGMLGISSDPSNGVGVAGGGGVIGVQGFTAATGGYAVLGQSFAGTAGQFYGDSPAYAALVAANPAGGPILQGFGGTQGSGLGTEVMALDNAGDLTIAGNLTTGKAPTSMTVTSTGKKVLMYGTQQSVRTLEDIGEAQLVGGAAVVQLETTFASAIDTRTPYLVFITPQGKSNGLYVTQKTPSSFAVRENNGARSTVTFDYRIVARPYSSTEQRMPPYTAPSAAGAVTAQTRLLQRIRSRAIRSLHQ